MSVQYGTDALGGVINTITCSGFGQEGFRGRYRLLLGTNNSELTNALSLSHWSKRWFFRVAGRWRDADEYTDGDGNVVETSFYHDRMVAGEGGASPGRSHAAPLDPELLRARHRQGVERGGPRPCSADIFSRGRQPPPCAALRPRRLGDAQALQRCGGGKLDRATPTGDELLGGLAAAPVAGGQPGTTCFGLQRGQTLSFIILSRRKDRLQLLGPFGELMWRRAA